jgi:hypothetical protein
VQTGLLVSDARQCSEARHADAIFGQLRHWLEAHLI